MLFHMHHMYLRMLEDSLTNQLDYWRICDAQIQYHTVLAQIRSDLPKVEKDDKNRKYYKQNSEYNLVYGLGNPADVLSGQA